MFITLPPRTLMVQVLFLGIIKERELVCPLKGRYLCVNSVNAVLLGKYGMMNPQDTIARCARAVEMHVHHAENLCKNRENK